MRLLLDTSAVVHLAAGTLPPAAADALRGGGLAVLPPVVPWELAIREQLAVLPPDRAIPLYPVAAIW